MKAEFEAWFMKTFPDAVRIPPGPWMAYQAGALAMRERAAKELDCGCECRAMVLGDGGRYSCTQTAGACLAIEAAAIRALPVGE